MAFFQQFGRNLLFRSETPLLSGPTTTFVRGAKKKAGGSTTNGRGSAGRRLGIKVWHNQYAIAGNILVRQRGVKFRPGDESVGIGKDHTIFARTDGYVKMTRRPDNKKRWEVFLVPDDQLAVAPHVQEVSTGSGTLAAANN